jgi:hypothetical protein
MDHAMNNTLIKIVYVSNTFWQLVCLVWSTIKVPSALYFFCSPRILLTVTSETFVPFPLCFVLSTAAFCNVWALARLPPPLLF